jgi:hypothetical protein
MVRGTFPRRGPMHPMTRGVLVNDVHSRLNPTRVREVVSVACLLYTLTLPTIRLV